MPQRVIRPVIQHIRSPITMRAVALFIACAFIIYTLIRDHEQRQASHERHEAINQYTIDARTALDTARQHNSTFEQSLQTTKGLLLYMGEMTESMRSVADVLRVQQQATAKVQKAQSIQRKKPAPKRVAKNTRECYELRPSTQQIGNNAVIVKKYTKIPCDP